MGRYWASILRMKKVMGWPQESRAELVMKAMAGGGQDGPGGDEEVQELRGC